MLNSDQQLYKTTKKLVRKGFSVDQVNQQLYAWYAGRYSQEELSEYHAVIRQHLKGAK